MQQSNDTDGRPASSTVYVLTPEQFAFYEAARRWVIPILDEDNVTALLGLRLAHDAMIAAEGKPDGN